MENQPHAALPASSPPRYKSHFADYFAHPDLRRDRNAKHRARIMILTMLATTALHVVLALVMSLTPGLANSRAVELPISFSSIAIMAYSLYQLKRNGNYWVCCFIVVALNFIAIVASAIITGGPYQSPSTQFLGIPCMMAFFLGGLTWGITVVIISTITLAALMLAGVSGITYPQLLPAEFAPIVQAFVLPINFSIVTMLAFIYELSSVNLISERDKEHQKVVQLARTDPLTGLVNRRIFEEMLAARIELHCSISPPRQFALCFVDLDSFKPINDKYGHDVGDEVLNAISVRLQQALRGADFVGRLGGDEFLLTLDQVDNPGAVDALAARFLALLNKPVMTSVGSLQVGASLGFAIFPAHGKNIPELQKAADCAMYEAKRRQSGYSIFESKTETVTA